MADSFGSDIIVNGTVVCRTFTVTTASITDAMIVAGAGVQSSKMEHRFSQVYAQPAGNSAIVERKSVHRVVGATATLLDFNVWASTAALGGATATIDLKKNGTTVLTSTISLDNTTAANIGKAGTFASTSLVAGDVLDVDITAVAAGGGTLAKGLSAEVRLREDPT